MNLYSASPYILQKLIWIPTRLALKVFGRIQIHGLDNLESLSSNAVFVCNHTSELDPILIPASLPMFSRFAPIFYTSREEKFYENSGWRRHFYGGLFFKAWGAYPVCVGLHDYSKSLINHIGIIKDGGNLCVFPEGRITINGDIQPAKGGVAYLGHVTGVPIVPVYLGGAYKMSFWDFIFFRRKLSVRFGLPINISDFGNPNPSVEDFKEIANKIMAKVGEMKACY